VRSGKPHRYRGNAPHQSFLFFREGWPTVGITHFGGSFNKNNQAN
jgi:hypothetical protein